MMNSASLEAKSAVVRADAPRQRKPVLRGKPQEQARKGYATRVLKKEAEATRLKAATYAVANAGRDSNTDNKEQAHVGSLLAPHANGPTGVGL